MAPPPAGDVVPTTVFALASVSHHVVQQYVGSRPSEQIVERSDDGMPLPPTRYAPVQGIGIRTKRPEGKDEAVLKRAAHHRQRRFLL